MKNANVFVDGYINNIAFLVTFWAIAKSYPCPARARLMFLLTCATMSHRNIKGENNEQVSQKLKPNRIRCHYGLYG